MRYRLIVFDFDGTLADSFPWFIDRINEVADRYRFRRIEKGEIETLRGYGARQMIRHLNVAWWKLPLIARHIRRRMGEEIHRVPRFEGVDGMLHRLVERGATLAVLTSNSYANVRRVLGPESTARITYFECDVSIFGKSARLAKLLRRSGFAPGEVLCIGDEIRDLEAAHRRGIAFGGVGWGYTTAESLRARSPRHLFAGVGEIAHVLD